MDRDTIINGLRMTMALCTFDPSTGEETDPDMLNDTNRATYDACKGALEILEKLPAQSDVTDTNVGDMIGRLAKYTNMGKLISESAFYEAIYKLPIREEKADGENHYYLVSIADIFEMLEKLPPAQPEIIRCKDCKHWDGVDTCDVIDAPVWDNDFCSMAERRSDEE